jgi:hypothetical protein
MSECPVTDRRAFLQLVEEIHRELALPLPAMHLESDDSIAVSLDLGDAPFEIIHSLTRNSSSVLIDCAVGPAPDDALDESGYRLLRASGELFRTRQASLGVDAARQTLFSSQWKPLASWTAADLLAEASALAGPLRAWARAGLHEDHLPGIPGAGTPTSLIANGDCIYWRRISRAIVESMAAKQVAAEDRGGDAGPMAAIEIAHDEVLFSAVHSFEAPRRLTLELTLGPAADLPAGETALLLRLNRELSRGDCAAFSIDPLRDLVRFACALDLEALNGESLKQRMTELAALVKRRISGTDCRIVPSAIAGTRQPHA